MFVYTDGDCSWTTEGDTVVLRFSIKFGFPPSATLPILHRVEVRGIRLPGEDLPALPERTRLLTQGETGELRPTTEPHRFQPAAEDLTEALTVEACFPAVTWDARLPERRTGTIHVRLLFKHDVWLHYGFDAAIGTPAGRSESTASCRLRTPRRLLFNGAALLGIAATVLAFNSRNSNVVAAPALLSPANVAAFLGAMFAFLGLNVARLLPLMVSWMGIRALLEAPEIYIGRDATDFLQRKLIARLIWPVAVVLALTAVVFWPVSPPVSPGKHWALVTGSDTLRLADSSRVNFIRTVGAATLVQFSDSIDRLRVATLGPMGVRDREVVVVVTDGASDVRLRCSLANGVAVSVARLLADCPELLPRATQPVQSRQVWVDLSWELSRVASEPDTLFVRPPSLSRPLALLTVEDAWATYFDVNKGLQAHFHESIDSLVAIKKGFVGDGLFDPDTLWSRVRARLQRLLKDEGTSAQIRASVEVATLVGMITESGLGPEQGQSLELLSFLKKFYLERMQDSSGTERIGNHRVFGALATAALRIPPDFSKMSEVDALLEGLLRRQAPQGGAASYILAYVHAAVKSGAPLLPTRRRAVETSLRGVVWPKIARELKELAASSTDSVTARFLDDMARSLDLPAPSPVTGGGA